MMLQRFQAITWKLVLFIVLTGVFNLMTSGVSRGFNFSPLYIHTLLVKLSLFALVVITQAWQSYRLAPAISSTDEPDRAKGFYRRFLLTSTINLVLVASVILLGLKLRYG